MSHPSQIFVADPGIAERQAMSLSPFETSVLSVARHLFETYEQPEGQCWMQAFMEAEARFPAPYGATIAHAISVAVGALRTAQHGTFSYFRTSDALAPHAVTDTERRFVETLRHVADGRAAAARASAMMLCFGGPSQAFLAALERLCVLTGAVQETQFQD